MPQITCPNCGMTINLENRKEIDLSLIKNTVKMTPKTFTELLRTTRLPRKTLSLRLKELCGNGTIIKHDGMYTLNGTSQVVGGGKDFIKGFSRAFHDRRVKTGLMLIAFLLSSSISGYVLASFMAPKQYSPPSPQPPALLGNFTTALKVSNVEDLYAWQVVIAFDASELKVLTVSPGDGFGVSYPFFLNASDVLKDALLLGGSLHGDALGKKGSFTLATIVFGYFVSSYEPPLIVREKYLETFLKDSNGSVIPIGETTELTLEVTNQ